MARIPILTPETMTAEQRRVHDEVVSGPRGAVVGPLLAALHRPELADRWQKFGALLRYGTSLPSRLNELAIIAAARHWNAQTEWVIHARAAAAAGLSDVIIESVRKGERPDFDDPEDALVYDYARCLLSTGRVPETLHAAVRDRWGVVGVVELTALVGYYTMVAMTLNAHDLPLPAGESPQLDLQFADASEIASGDRVSGLSVPLEDTLENDRDAP